MAGTRIVGPDLTVPGMADIYQLRLAGGLPKQQLVFNDAAGDVGPADYNLTPGYSFNIANGAASGTITGLGLPFTPRTVYATVRRPAGGQVLSVAIDDGTLTADGFAFALSAATDSENYWLDYFFEW